MDFSFRFSNDNSFASTIETAGSLASTETTETAGSLAWISGSSDSSIDEFVSSNPFTPSVDYSQYVSVVETGGSFTSTETAGSLASVGCDMSGSVASAGCEASGSVASGGGDCGGCSSGGFSSVC